MNHLLIFGGRRLFGTVTAEGAKNAALPILFATLVTGGITILENIPQIEDVRLALSILSQLGAKILPLDAHSYRIDTRECQMSSTPPKEAKKLRGSTYLLGAEAGRFGYGQCVLPGGCNLGERPIDQHIKALQAFGCETKMSEGVVSFRTDGLLGTHFVFDKVSVGATINAILCAVKAKGETMLEGVSKEPHVVDLVRYLKSCGASIEGEGTDTIFVSGGKVLHGTTYRIIGDMMEAGTYLIAGVATGGEVTVCGVDPSHLFCLSEMLQATGASVTQTQSSITAKATNIRLPLHLETAPYPAFPTDLHPQMSALLCGIPGESTIHETIWEDRFRYTTEFARAGAKISSQSATVSIQGGAPLRGAIMQAVDLRAGAAEVILALMAPGMSLVEGRDMICRGYESMDKKFRQLGGYVYAR